MINSFIWAIGATVIVSLIALIGIFVLMIKEKALNKILLGLVGFAAGALIGGAFLHILPEAFGEVASTDIFLFALVGFVVFFIMERLFKWRHCHKGKCDVHTFTYMSLFGDAIHNFVDGVIIAASFITSIPLGIAATIAIIAHEVPQEIGDFAVLVYGGFSKIKALFFNFLVALTAIIGAVFGYFLAGIEGITPFVLTFAAGGFIYIAASDLIPELHKEEDLKKSIMSFAMFLIGIIFMWGIKTMFA